MSSASDHCAATASSTAATVAGSISEGVPPPKKIERTVRRADALGGGGNLAGDGARRSAPGRRPAGGRWLLKSQ